MSKASYFKKGIAVITAAGVVAAMSCGTAFASAASKIASSNEGMTVNDNLLTTMGARAGSAGPDFLGITNMNYDFQPSHTAGLGDPYPYYKVVEGVSKTGYKADLNSADQFNRLAIWGSGINTNANPYYQNLLADALTGTATEGGLDTSKYTLATTYHTNANSWGDITCNGASVVSEDYEPDIIFGANKYTNWAEGDYGTGTKAKAAADAIDDYNPTYANNDSTNVWSQMYTIGQLATVADNMTSTSDKVTRYNNSNAVTSAVNYEKSIKGQMLYVASQIDQKKTTKKKVAYLYAIDSEANKAYFFVPEADDLASGNDTGAGVVTGQADSDDQDVYAANNSTINMGYMATLPFVTDTFGAKAGEGTKREGGIQMIVEDIYKRNPVVEVTADTAKDVMKDVDVIIYNSTKTVGTMKGTSNGKCIDADINNTAALTDASVAEWAKTYGFTGTTLAGDDFGTSTQQNSADAVGTTTGQSPMLYCARNYTVDKNARAAWGFSKVYPELYGNNDDASYAYWVENIYHIEKDSVSNVVAAYTHQSTDTVNVYADNTAQLDAFAQEGYNWYASLDSTSTYKTDYAYFNGSSRASYYSGNKSAQEPKNTIGIFAPSALWTASASSAYQQSLADKITEVQTELTKTEEELTKANTDLKDATDKLTEAQKNITSLQGQLDTAVTNNNTLKNQVSELQTSLDKATAALETATDQAACMARGDVSKTVKLKGKKKTQKAASITLSSMESATGHAVTFSKVSGKKITVASNGKVTLAKGVKKGTHKAKVKVSCGNAAGNVVTITFKVVK